VELQRSLKDITRQGLGLAAISYDSPDILKGFAEKHGITFPMLSDPGSKTITAWGILNREATGRTAGIPYPGTYVIDRSGVIRSRDFEPAYQERDTAASILLRLAAGAPAARPGTSEVIGRHIRVRASASDAIAAPGHRLTLMVDVSPGSRIHVYAPGQAGYIPIALTLDASPDYKVMKVNYPASTRYVFAPLKEAVHVFDKPFRLTEDVTLALTPAVRQRATNKETLAISGHLEYQACDDTVCFPPETLALKWTISLTPIER
jgi:hypothetical protein